MKNDTNARVPHAGLSFAAFVSMMAGFMALNALAIDAMLPALPAIGEELNVADPNDRQLVISSYLLGFGIFQIVYGPLSDRFGRRPVLLFGVLVYALLNVVTVFAHTFEAVVATRFLQGAGSAASRVMVVAIVRDCYSGRKMARVMSLAFIIFLATPILAPAIGQAIMQWVSWHWIFLALAIFASGLSIWAWARLPETLHEDNRLPLSMERVLIAFRLVATTRQSVGYTVGMTLVLGGLFGYVNSVQQIFADVFLVQEFFVVYFAITAMSVIAASFLNSRIVESLGTRIVSHSALCSMLVVSLLGAIIASMGLETLTSFLVVQALIMFCFGLTAPNFGAMAMEPVGHIAGTASSVQGCVTTVGAAILGYLTGQAFDGTTIPMIGSFALYSALAIGVVLLTEKRLFRPQQA